MAENRPKKKQPNYIKLTGIAAQMGITIFAGSYLGGYLDDSYSEGGKTYLIVCTLAAIVLAFYVLIKQLNGINNGS